MSFGFQLCEDFDPQRVSKNAVLEIKEDGVLLMWDGNTKTIWNRDDTKTGNNVTHRYPDVVPLLRTTFPNSIVVFEACVFGSMIKDRVVFKDDPSNRVSVFNGIQQRSLLDNKKEIQLRCIPSRYPVTAYVFDIVEHDGESVCGMSLSERRKILEKLVPNPVRDSDGYPRILLAEQFPMSDFERLKQEVDVRGMEGLVIKDLDAPYKAERNSSWMKWKPFKQANFSILRFETTKGDHGHDGFVVYVLTSVGEEQRVVINDRNLIQKVKNGAKGARVAFLSVTKEGRLRQPYVVSVG